MRVALKYCGGCDPAYERGPYFARIREAAGPEIEWVRLEEGDYQAVLLICGCDTACPREEMPAGVPLVCLTNDEQDPARVVGLLLDKEG